MRMLESRSEVGISVLEYAVKMAYGRDNKLKTETSTTRRPCCCFWDGRLGLQKVALAWACTFSRSVVRILNGDEGLLKLCCRRTLPIFLVFCGSSMHSGYAGMAAGSSKWTYALRGGVCPDCRRAWRTAPTLLEGRGVEASLEEDRQ